MKHLETRYQLTESPKVGGRDEVPKEGLGSINCIFLAGFKGPPGPFQH